MDRNDKTVYLIKCLVESQQLTESSMGAVPTKQEFMKDPNSVVNKVTALASQSGVDPSIITNAKKMFSGDKNSLAVITKQVKDLEKKMESDPDLKKAMTKSKGSAAIKKVSALVKKHWEGKQEAVKPILSAIQLSGALSSMTKGTTQQESLSTCYEGESVPRDPIHVAGEAVGAACLGLLILIPFVMLVEQGLILSASRDPNNQEKKRKAEAAAKTLVWLRRIFVICLALFATYMILVLASMNAAYGQI